MPKLTLTTAQRQQLNDWLFGGATDDTGIIPLLEANAAGLVQPPLSPEVVYEQEGERDFYQLLLAKDGKNLLRSDITPKMADALNYVAGSLDEFQALGIPIDANQQAMRVLWNWVKNI